MINNAPQNTKSRNWFIIIYEESVNPDYINILKNACIKCAVSPAHNKDTDEKGNLLKPHRHILITFPTARNVSQIDSIIESINAYKHCEIVTNKEIAYRYLYHGDD